MKKYFYPLLLLVMTMALFASCGNPKNNEEKHGNGNTEKTHENGEEDGEKIGEDYPPMVKVDGHVYADMGYVNSAVTCGTYDGKILTTVDGSQAPEKDDESNFGEGYGYQFSDTGHINVHIKDQWHIFQDTAISSWTMPSGVANFKAKVQEVSEDTLLVTITEVPKDFQRSVHFEKMEEIKPISLSMENLEIKDDQLEGENIKGRIVQVWFDGVIKNNEPEMSYPMELGQVYKISILE